MAKFFILTIIFFYNEVCFSQTKPNINPKTQMVSSGSSSTVPQNTSVPVKKTATAKPPVYSPLQSGTTPSSKSDPVFIKQSDTTRYEIKNSKNVKNSIQNAASAHVDSQTIPDYDIGVIDLIKTRLELNPEQIEQVKSVLQTYKPKISSIMKNRGLTNGERVDLIRQLKGKIHGEFMNFLNDKQDKELEALLEEKAQVLKSSN